MPDDNFISLGEAAARVVSSIETYRITERAEWLKWRKQDITASVAGALFGVHDYTTALEQFMLKTGQLQTDPEETPAIRRGRLLEPVALQMLKEERPKWALQPNPGEIYYRDPRARVGATPDSIWVDPDRPGFGVVQIKSVEPFTFKRKWKGDDGAIEPPLWIAIQAAIEAALTGASWAAVAPMRVGFGIDIDVIDIPDGSALMQAVKQKVSEFWGMVERMEPPPPDFTKDGDLLKTIYAQENGETVDLTSDNMLPGLLAERAALSAQSTANEKRLKEINAEMLAKIGNAAAAICGDGWSFTAKTVKASTYTVERKAYRQLRAKRINTDE